MLAITTIKGATAAKRYYGASDYYLDDKQIPATWHGKLREHFNLPDLVSQEHFNRLCDSLHPFNGQPLTNARREDRDIGRDFTFSPVKSVSLAGLVGGDGRVIEAVNQSVAETMGVIEADISTRVRKKGVEGERHTGNMLWAAFPHLTTRPINGEVDPQYHVHAVLFNVTRDPAEKELKAIQFREVVRHKGYYQEVFRAKLGRKLAEMGYGIRRTKDAFEIVSVPERAIKEFSRRTAVIEKVVQDYGFTNPESIGKLGARTRERKAEGQAYGKLMGEWEARLSKQELNALRTHPKPKGQVADRSREAVDYALHHLLERKSVVSQRDVAKEALRYGVGSATVEGVYKAIGQADLVRREIDGVAMVSSKAVLNEEQRLIAFAVEGRGRFRPLGSQNPWKEAGQDNATLPPFAQSVSATGEIRNLGYPSGSSQGHLSPSNGHSVDTATLSPSQQAAVSHVLTSPDRIILVRGFAGTGKTTMTKAALEGVDCPYVVLAPSSEASRGVLRRDGFEGADTLARFLVDEKFREQARNGLVWLDEASLAGGHDVAKLTQLVDSLNARLVLSGDPRQHKSVARGDILTLLEEKAGLPAAHVSDVQRQRGSYKKAVEKIAKGDVSAGFRQLDDLGWVLEMPVEDKYGLAAQEYVGALKAGKSALLVSPTHKEGDSLTERVRQEMSDAGLLAGEERTFEVLRPTNWTEAERSDPRNYQEGHVLRFIRNVPGRKSGTKLDFTEGLGETVKAIPGAFQVYERGTVRLRKGDTVRLTANQVTADGHKANNGASYKVEGFDKNGNIALANGWKLAPDSGMFTNGLVDTSYASQGKTVDHVIVVQGDQSLPASGAAQFYVSVSRGREKASVWVDSKQDTLEAIQRDDKRLLASDLVKRPRDRIRKKLKRHVAFLRQLPSMVAQKVRDVVRNNEREMTYGR